MFISAPDLASSQAFEVTLWVACISCGRALKDR
jgi:hypothetical protein